MHIIIFFSRKKNLPTLLKFSDPLPKSHLFFYLALVLIHHMDEKGGILISWFRQNEGRGWRHKTGLSPPVKYFTDRSKAVLLLWIFYVFVLSCVCYVCARLFICALWSPAGKGLTSWLSFVVSSVTLSLSHWYPGSGVVLDCIDS